MIPLPPTTLPPSTAPEPDHESFFHPFYPSDSQYADIVLRSKDNIDFCVHSLILKLSSSVFRDLFEIPRCHTETNKTPITLDEDEDILSALLDIIYPNVMLRSDRIGIAIERDARRIIDAAEKYDMTAVVAFVRRWLFDDSGGTPTNENTWSPIRLYDLARKRGWSKEARVASRWTLKEGLKTPASLSELQLVSTATILELQKLHAYRIEVFFDHLLRSTFKFHTQYCEQAARSTLSRNDEWKFFVLTVTEELQNDPLGSALRDDNVWLKQGYSQILQMQAPSCSCYHANYFDFQGRLIDAVSQTLDDLPTFIT